jgi:Ca-activated chloride channel family protein
MVQASFRAAARALAVRTVPLGFLMFAVLIVSNAGCQKPDAAKTTFTTVGNRIERGEAKKAADRADFAAKDGAPGPHAHAPMKEAPNVEEYDRRNDNPFHLATNEPLSTFSIDVDTASYSNVRRMLNEGKLPPKDAVRVEEFINSFTYNYPSPEGEHPITVSNEATICPWNTKHLLVRVGVQGKYLDPSQIPARNLVFLLDTSGSMNAPNRLPLLRKALTMLTKQLKKQDKVSIVAYAGSAGLILPPTAGDQHEVITAALDRLHAGGSTNGGQGIELAYHVAEQAFIKDGANRVIIGTDGDFNVGVTGAELIRLIETKRNTGVFLTVLGFGMGNLKDGTMERLSQHGNGSYHYIDSFAEAHRVFVERLANLVPIAKDVKIQIEFNPAHVQAYRLIGYENRLMKHEDFNDDTKDAGDMGAGHTVTALYEIIPPGVEIKLPKVDGLKYQKKTELTIDAKSNEMMAVKLRYTLPTEKASKLLTTVITQDRRPFDAGSSDFRFAASVASFAMLLRDSPYRGDTNYLQVQRWAEGAKGPDEQGHRREFLRLVQKADLLTK